MRNVERIETFLFSGPRRRRTKRRLLMTLLLRNLVFAQWTDTKKRFAISGINIFV